MPPLFKDGNATFQQAQDLVRRREFDKAAAKFRDAAVKYRNEGSILYVDLANVSADLVSYPVRNGQPAALTGVSSTLRARLGPTEIRLGPRGISASDLATQLELTAKEANLLAAAQAGVGDPNALAQALQGLADDYRQLGNQVLYLPELFDQRAVSTEPKVPILMALSFEILGTSLEGSNPLAAAEHFQTAQQYWSQAGDAGRAEAAATRVGHLAFQAKCWFCGREGTGHGIQFVSLPIAESVAGLKDSGSSPLPSLDSSGRNVFACKGCYSATIGLADRVASQRMGEAEARMNARLRALEARILSQTREG